MKNLLFASALAILILLSACTSNGSKKISSSETTPDIYKTPQNSSHIYKRNTSIPDQLAIENGIVLSNEAMLSKDTTTSNETISSEDVITSNEINHALELCELAQKSWKQGSTEKSLQYLDAAYASILDLETDDNRVNKQKEDLRFMISKRIMEIYTSRQTSIKGEHKEIPVTIDNKYVKSEIERFTGSEKEFFIKAMGRAAEYRPFIVKELKEAGLPEELSWLPLIESGFKVKALSPARALGLWQFIPSTGYKFGLKRDYYVDERMDPIKSTKAAIKYLSALHKMFGDWSTVLAAYNCGEGRVLRTIRSQNVNYLDNFWDLYEKLPKETACYVPRFIATLHIVNNLEKYGFPPQRKVPPLEYQIVTVNKQLKLTDIARKMSISHTLLETLNPELKYGVLPPENYQLRVPKHTVDAFIASIDDIKPSDPVSPKNYSSHKVKNGETLFSIAKKYGITMGELAGANNISKQSSISSGKLLKIPESGSTSNQYAYNNNSKGINDRLRETKLKEEVKSGQISNSSKKNRTLSMKAVKYEVKQGDTMWSIAQKYNTTPESIKAANSLSDYTLSPDQKLIIPKSNTVVASKIKEEPKIYSKGNKSSDTNGVIASNYEKKNTVKSKKSTHWVKSGETPFTIAQKYNISVQSLFNLNGLPKGSKIFPGQTLLVK
ncbi:MAG: LysM peptidoglycan-binding domain-containing protein [Desulfamplus sp.]|nr:LysM peptidoglycan-binding domain-containing protein [Desulfamplus sp.]